MIDFKVETRFSDKTKSIIETIEIYEDLPDNIRKIIEYQRNKTAGRKIEYMRKDKELDLITKQYIVDSMWIDIDKPAFTKFEKRIKKASLQLTSEGKRHHDMISHETYYLNPVK